ncbi:MAG TPA: NCS2 family permease [Chloroflexota bacterium]|jgi:AGZA family xanthine/uracil permease-like MFS transporter|nr:NCS2 family permease [Chloroflexota bacterium]
MHEQQHAAANRPFSPIERFFQIRERQSSIGTELRGGVTTFVVMSYILFVNPVILSVLTQGRGPDVVATATMTALAAGVATLAMGLYANYPLALAPGMGLNAFVAFDLIVGRGLPWQTAMGAVFIEGAIITVLVLTGFREAVLWAIPLNLKRAIGVGIGFFILFIGLVNAGFVRVPVETLQVVDGRVVGQPSPPITLGNLTGWPVFVAVFGLFLTALLLVRRVRGALLLGIVLTTGVALLIHALTGADISAAPGVQGALPTELPPISFATFGAGLNVSIFTALPALSAALIVFSIMLSDFFDTMGTVIGIGSEAGWLDEQGRLPNIQRVLLVDSLAAAFGGIAAASSVTTYIESAAGVAEGARTGLASVVTGALFLVAIVFAPLAGLVPAEATAPALIVVGFYMAAVLRDIDFLKVEEGLPALLTITVMPATYSITDGIGAGFILWTFLRVVLGRAREVHWMMYVVSAAFVLYFALALLRSLFGW